MTTTVGTSLTFCKEPRMKRRIDVHLQSLSKPSRAPQNRDGMTVGSQATEGQEGCGTAMGAVVRWRQWEHCLSKSSICLTNLPTTPSACEMLLFAQCKNRFQRRRQGGAASLQRTQKQLHPPKPTSPPDTNTSPFA